MSDIKQITVSGTIKEGIGIGFKNIGPILVNLVLWVITLWIPYLNVGTTIGMFVGIIAKASRDEAIPMTEIFNGKYRKYMGEFFLTSGLVGLGVSIGFVFMVIPGIIISIAWFFAVLIVIDKGKNPSEAITLSNNATYGNKGKIFGVLFLVCLIASVIMSLLIVAFVNGAYFVIIFIIALMLLMMFFVIGIQASLYKQLTSDI